MKTGRPPRAEPLVNWRIRPPLTLAQEVELLLVNPATGKVPYGAREKLIEQLLREWLDKQRKGHSSG